MGDTFDSKGGEQNIAQGKAAYRKVLALGEARQDKEKQAIALGNLGNVYQTRGELDKAEAAWQKSLSLFQEMGHPNAKKVQQWLDKLAQKRASR